jgi:hypothetical protein
VRQDYHRGDLSDHEAPVLERQRGWAWKAREVLWTAGLKFLRRFVEREGHASVPHHHREGGFALGAWIHRKRQDYLRGALSAERIQTLEELPGWSWDARGTAWEAGLKALLDFVEREGHARVPGEHVTVDGFKLGDWVHRKRLYLQRGTIPDEHRRALEKIKGWTWDAKRAALDDGLRALRRFVRRRGHSRVPVDHVEAGCDLGHWVNLQRLSYRRGTLSKERIMALEAIAGWSG